jgi:hypothetical protein
MGMRMPETCWTVFERRAINLRDWCIWLFDLFECMMMHGLTNPKLIYMCWCICTHLFDLCTSFKRGFSTHDSAVCITAFLAWFLPCDIYWQQVIFYTCLKRCGNLQIHRIKMVLFYRVFSTVLHSSFSSSVHLVFPFFILIIFSFVYPFFLILLYIFHYFYFVHLISVLLIH